jgi:hypothetical protein
MCQRSEKFSAASIQTVFAARFGLLASSWIRVSAEKYSKIKVTHASVDIQKSNISQSYETIPPITDV